MEKEIKNLNGVKTNSNEVKRTPNVVRKTPNGVRKNSKTLKTAGLLVFLSLFTSCYSVFNAGVGGQVVDAESTSTPKSGIANVDVYVYTDSGARDNDFNNWEEGKTFTPQSGYYGHTTTGADGSFTLSKVVWKEYAPTFGKDADVQDLYMLFYHEDYGLTRGQTVVVSDSTSDQLYTELTKIRKNVALTLNFKDVKNGSVATTELDVEVSVPQSNGKIVAENRVFKGTITGSGTINISYPRYLYDSAENKSENAPKITITYKQTADEITWKPCWNADNDGKNYAFRDLDSDPIEKTIPSSTNESYSYNLYGKACRLSLPTLSGTYHSDGSDFGSSADDGLTITAKIGEGTEERSVDSGSEGTSVVTIGTTNTQVIQNHGNFTITPDSNDDIFDDTYTDKTLTLSVKFYVGTKELNSTFNSISTKESSYSGIKLNDQNLYKYEKKNNFFMSDFFNFGFDGAGKAGFQA